MFYESDAKVFKKMLLTNRLSLVWEMLPIYCHVGVNGNLTRHNCISGHWFRVRESYMNLAKCDIEIETPELDSTVTTLYYYAGLWRYKN